MSYGSVIVSAQINLWSLCFGQTNSLVLRLQGWVSLRSGQTTCFAYLDFFVVVNFGMRMRQQTCVARVNMSASPFRFNVIVWMSLRFGQTFMSLFG